MAEETKMVEEKTKVRFGTRVGDAINRAGDAIARNKTKVIGAVAAAAGAVVGAGITYVVALRDEAVDEAQGLADLTYGYLDERPDLSINVEDQSSGVFPFEQKEETA